MTPVLIGKGFVLKGWSPKIEDKQVPGIYSFTPSPGHSFSPSESFRRQTDSQLPGGEAIDVQVKFIGNPGALPPKMDLKGGIRYTWRMGPHVVFLSDFLEVYLDRHL